MVVSPRIRLIAAGVLAAAAIGGAAAAASGPGAAAPPPRPARIASLAPAGAVGALTAAQATQAAKTCASHAAAAGWANNGVYGGNLVTAVAVCIAESGGQPKIFHCDATGAVGTYPPVSCSHGSYDRGLWQLNSQYQTGTPDSCAFAAQCNANAAYQISGAGISFSPWAVYNSRVYASHLADAQTAVSALTAGAVASGVFGVCLGRAQQTAGAAAVVARCGHSSAAQQWTVASGALATAGLCLTGAPTARSTVTLAACTGSASQTWSPHGLGQLRNGQSGLCLNDPGSSARAGKPLIVGSCSRVPRETWWLP
jgi:hypothetical protein